MKLSLTKSRGRYRLQAEPAEVREERTVLRASAANQGTATTYSKELVRWHMRFAHLNYPDLRRMAAPPKAPKNPLYINLTAKRLLTNDDCMAARRLKENELEDQRQQKAEKKRQATLRREAKVKEKEEKQIARLVKKRLREVEEEKKKAEREEKKVEKAAKKRKQEEDKLREREEKKRGQEEIKHRKAEALRANRTAPTSKEVSQPQLQSNFNLNQMSETAFSKADIYKTCDPFEPSGVPSKSQNACLVDELSPRIIERPPRCKILFCILQTCNQRLVLT